VQACLELTRLRWLSFSSQATQASQASQATLPLEGVELGSVLVVSVSYCSILFIVLFSIHLFYFTCSISSVFRLMTIHSFQ
jgi:hypothetical protein